MAPSRHAPKTIVLSCTLIERFLHDHEFGATVKAFRKERTEKKWNTDEADDVHEAGIKPLEDIITEWQLGRSVIGDLRAESSRSRGIGSASSDSEEEEGEGQGDESDGGEMTLCQWRKCSKRFHTAHELYNHVCEDHIGSYSSGKITLNCRWSDCSYGPASKRDHITSHMRTHIDYKPFKCESCEKTFRRLADKKKHLKTHKNIEPSSGRTAQASNGLKRKAIDSSEAAQPEKPAKRMRANRKSQLDGANSDSSSISSSSESSSSSSDRDSEVISKTNKTNEFPMQNGASDAQTASPSSSSDGSTSGDDSSDSESDVSSSSSGDSDSDVSITSSEHGTEAKFQDDCDQAASNSSDTVQGDKKTSPETLSSEDIPREGKLAKAMDAPKKHVGAQPTPLAQLSAKAMTDSHISNAYVRYDYAERAYKDLSVTRGKGFTKEKNKKKRGSYRGGAIDISGGKGFKFDD